MISKKGVTLIELMVATGIFLFISAASFLVLHVGKIVWSTTDARINITQNLRLTLERISRELQESGEDETGVLQVTVMDGLGNDGTDIIRFSIPMCPCGISVLNQNGDIAVWGAPFTWRETECHKDPPLETNGKVKICHIPPGNPGNPQNLEVSVSSLNAHLAHGDYVGECGTCVINDYKYIEFRQSTDNRVLRRVLDSGFSIVREDVFAFNISDLQASISVDQKVVTLTVSALSSSNQHQQVNLTRSQNVYLRNKE